MENYTVDHMARLLANGGAPGRVPPPGGGGARRCALCGGPGHEVAQCPRTAKVLETTRVLKREDKKGVCT